MACERHRHPRPVDHVTRVWRRRAQIFKPVTEVTEEEAVAALKTALDKEAAEKAEHEHGHAEKKAEHEHGHAEKAAEHEHGHDERRHKEHEHQHQHSGDCCGHDHHDEHGHKEEDHGHGHSEHK